MNGTSRVQVIEEHCDEVTTKSAQRQQTRFEQPDGKLPTKQSPCRAQLIRRIVAGQLKNRHFSRTTFLGGQVHLPILIHVREPYSENVFSSIGQKMRTLPELNAYDREDKPLL
jgi:hypothetical protein